MCSFILSLETPNDVQSVLYLTNTPCSFIFQFESPPPKFPTKAIALAVTLFVIGTILLVIGSFLLTGVIDAKVSFSYSVNLFVIQCPMGCCVNW